MTRIVKKVKEIVAWIDSHPRTGWYIAVMVTLHFVLELAQAVL
jgi:hypothetical protein